MEKVSVIDNMSDELCTVLKKNLYKLLDPVFDKHSNTNDVLLNFPLTKQLTNKVKELEEKLIEVNCTKNIEIHSLTKKIEEQKKIINNLREKLNGVNSIKLEVKELETISSNVINLEELNDTFIKNKKINNNPRPLETMNMFSLLDDDDEDEDEDYQYSEDENDEDDINPFPPNSLPYKQYENGNIFPPIQKAPFVWSTLSKYPPQEVRDAYDFLDWSITDKYKGTDISKENPEINMDNKNHYGVSVIKAQNADDATIDTVSEEHNEEEVDEEEVDEEEDDEEEDEEGVYEEVEVDEEEDSEEELELEEIVINEIKYLTDDLKNGTIYKCDKEGEIIEDDEGDLIVVGKFNNKKAEIYF